MQQVQLATGVVGYSIIYGVVPNRDEALCGKLYCMHAAASWVL